MLWFVDVSFVGFKFTRHAVYHVRSEGPEQLNLFFPGRRGLEGSKTNWFPEGPDIQCFGLI